MMPASRIAESWAQAILQGQSLGTLVIRQMSDNQARRIRAEKATQKSVARPTIVKDVTPCFEGIHASLWWFACHFQKG